jgi:hypothetical protein
LHRDFLSGFYPRIGAAPGDEPVVGRFFENSHFFLVLKGVILESPARSY